MSEEFVSRNEFNTLKNEVQELKIKVNEYKGILTQIDKKIDVIGEKIRKYNKSIRFAKGKYRNKNYIKIRAYAKRNRGNKRQ